MSEVESVESFAERSRLWLADSMPRVDPDAYIHGLGSDEAELAFVDRQRQLQRVLFDGGFAGICFPAEYGGQGLSAAHQNVFNIECVGYQMPALINVPTFVPCGAVLLEFGTEEQKQKHIPSMLKGEKLWMQFLSEPSGGSDVAGALTTAVRDGEEWLLNGSKVWTTGAWWSDMGLCLVRTNWDVPKHRGLSVFIIDIADPNIDVQRIEMLNGSREFCQEFLTDVRVPDSDRVGEVDDGWTVGRRWMFHERNAMGGGSPLVSGPGVGHGGAGSGVDPSLVITEAMGRTDDPVALDLIGESLMLRRAATELTKRVGEGMASGAVSDTSAAITRLMNGVVMARNWTIHAELAGSAAVAWESEGPLDGVGVNYLMRQSNSIAGGTVEMARNNISERVLGMPRERTLDKDVAFRDVPKGPPASR
ncbi:MAG: acyl-CoA dehydrogenase family protein [Acidobacteria bacterium]|nr:acyl-CoA dehydrogenase family protein [Acidobacteriota bacterium]